MRKGQQYDTSWLVSPPQTHDQQPTLCANSRACHVRWEYICVYVVYHDLQRGVICYVPARASISNLRSEENT